MEYTETDAIDEQEGTLANKQSRWWWFIKQCTLQEAGDFTMDPDECAYAGWRVHAAPTTGQVHVHCLVNFKQPKRFGALQNRGYSNLKYVVGKTHINNCRNYLVTNEHQDGSPKGVLSPEIEEIGVWKHGVSQGARSDLAECCDDLKEHTLDDIAIKYPTTYVRNYRGLASLKQIYDKKIENRDVQVTVYYGDSGAGKTHSVFEENDRSDVYQLCMGRDLWFDGYNGQSVLLIDDSIKRFKYHELLKYLDKYPIQLPIKGGHVWANYTKVFITMVSPPEEWYRNLYDRQLERRLNKIVHFTGDYQAGVPTVKTVIKDDKAIAWDNTSPIREEMDIEEEVEISDEELLDRVKNGTVKFF